MNDTISHENNFFRFSHVTKAYGAHRILDDFTFDFAADGDYVLTGESGIGKTTLLRLLAGIELPTSGTAQYCKTFGIVFQEDRLCEHFTAVDNIRMIRNGIREETAREELLQLLPAESLHQPVYSLSGGMKRRVAVVRACMADGEALLLDEVLTGLDADNRKRVINYILSHKRNRMLVFTAHDAVGFEFCEEIHLRNR